MRENIDYVIRKLSWMEENEVWPIGSRCIWSDAFGMILYVSLYFETQNLSYILKAELLFDRVQRYLDLNSYFNTEYKSQYYHYFNCRIMWVFALTCLGKVKAEYQLEAVNYAKKIYSRLVMSSHNDSLKKIENFGNGARLFRQNSMDVYYGYVIYKLLNKHLLAEEIKEMRDAIEKTYKAFYIEQTTELGMMLWLCHFYPAEQWSIDQYTKSMKQINALWIDIPGYFGQQQDNTEINKAFTSYIISLGLQAHKRWPKRVLRTNQHFDKTIFYKDKTSPITHLMACASNFPGNLLRNNLLNTKSNSN